MNRHFVFAFLASLGAAGSFLAPAVHAQVSLPDRYSHPAKFVCGVSQVPTTAPPNEPVVKMGNYATAVNIHNPWAVDVIITKQVVISNPERFPDTRFDLPTKRFTDKVPSGSSLYVDCTEVVNLLKLSGQAIPGTFIEGFVVVDSYFAPTSTVPATAADLDVVTVTTTAPWSAAGAANTGVNSHEITIVPGRHLPKGTWPM
jgi:hypothetical protein